MYGATLTNTLIFYLANMVVESLKYDYMRHECQK